MYVHHAGGRSTAQVDHQATRPRRWLVHRAGGPVGQSTTQVGMLRRHRPSNAQSERVCSPRCVPRRVSARSHGTDVENKKATHNKNHKEYRFSVDPATATRSPASVGPLDKIGACRARALQSFTAAGCGCGACTQATCSKTPPSKKKAPFYTSLPCAVIGHCPCAYVPRSCTILSRIRVSASRVFPDFT